MNELNYLIALFILCIILLFCSCYNYKEEFDASGLQYQCDDYGLCHAAAPVMMANHNGAPLYQGQFGLGRYPGDNYPDSGCDLARLHTGRPNGSLGSPLEPTTMTYPEILGYFGTGVQTAYTPNEMAAMRSRDGLVHAGWVNSSQPGYVLTNSDRWNVGYKYQVGSSIQVVT